jgi:hypothetical protein
MSEFQYYEFQAIDRPLTREEQAEVATLSSRVQLSSRRAVFTYSYGNFRGDPKKVLARYFDAMLYQSNWGSRQIILRFPRSALDPQLFNSYVHAFDAVSLEVTDNQLILDMDFAPDESEPSWLEEESASLSLLLGVREELLRGDERLLYLAWLKAAQDAGGYAGAATPDIVPSPDEEDGDGDDEDDWVPEDPEVALKQVEPPVPAGLQKLSPALEAFVEFCEIDQDLLGVAAELSAKPTQTTHELEPLIAKLTESEKDRFLLRLAQGEPLLDIALTRRLRELEERPAGASAKQARRTVTQLFAAAKERAEQRLRQERKLAEQARLLKLKQMEAQEPGLWDKVAALIEEKKSSAYDQATVLLQDLAALARHKGRQEEFSHRVRLIHETYPTRSALLERLRKAKLLP